MSSVVDPLRRIVVALDTSSREEFSRWCQLFGPRVGMLKVGLESFVLWGQAAVEEARRHARGLFLDLKLHDIPNTVAGAVRAARELEVDLLTVHVGGGAPMLRAAREAAGEELGLLGVTLLTHLDQEALVALGYQREAARLVEEWGLVASESDLTGVVCSPRELEHLRRAHARPFLLVTPGVRPSFYGAPDDQRRVATPREALEAGADYLVMGRPLTRAADPARAVEALERELSGAPSPESSAP